MPDEKYEDVQLTDLDDHLRAFRWERRGDEWIYIGTCRRCTHEVDKRFLTTQVRAFEEGREVSEQTRTMRCNCAGSHDGREPGQEGCGAWWGLSLTRR